MEVIVYSLYLFDMLICVKFCYGFFLFSSWMVEVIVYVFLFVFVWLFLDILFIFIDVGIVLFM